MRTRRSFRCVPLALALLLTACGDEQPADLTLDVDANEIEAAAHAAAANVTPDNADDVLDALEAEIGER